MSAYRIAEKDMIALNTPELRSNKRIALRYEEDYVNVLKCFKRVPLNLERTLTKFLMDVKHLIEMKGKLKTKRYNTMVNSIDSKNIGKVEVF